MPILQGIHDDDGGILNASDYFQWAELKTIRCTQRHKDLTAVMAMLQGKYGEKANIRECVLRDLFPGRGFGDSNKTITCWMSES